MQTSWEIFFLAKIYFVNIIYLFFINTSIISFLLLINLTNCFSSLFLFSQYNSQVSVIRIHSTELKKNNNNLKKSGMKSRVEVIEEQLMTDRQTEQNRTEQTDQDKKMIYFLLKFKIEFKKSSNFTFIEQGMHTVFFYFFCLFIVSRFLFTIIRFSSVDFSILLFIYLFIYLFILIVQHVSFSADSH